MQKSWRAAAALVSGVATFAIPAAASAEEGMWTFDNFPSERMRNELGWAPDQAWLNRAMQGSGRLPGCSSSNVSPEGLMLTNHHCVIACVRSLSTAELNYLADGFAARAREDERRCPGMHLEVLTEITDVTSRIEEAAANTAPELFARARDAEIARLEAACSAGSIRCEVVTLYQGGRYALYRYKRYDDVRLVFAPEHDMAAFGGEADNFVFPRYVADFAFLRAYERGQPAATPNHLALRFTPVEEGEIVLAAGSPGATSRLRSAAELAFERDVHLPWRIAALDAWAGRLRAYAAQGPDEARIASSLLQSVTNLHKGLEGRLAALADAEGFARIEADETDLRARVRRNLAARREVGTAWEDVAAAQTAYRRMFHDYQYLELRAGEMSELFAWARDIVRGVEEREKPEADRLPRYRDANLPAIFFGLRAFRPVTPAFEQVQLEAWLSSIAARGGPLAQRVLKGESPASLAARLSQSRLADATYRVELWEGGTAAVAASEDPLLQFVRGIDADARAVRARYQQQVERPTALAQERIARARFHAFGDETYPDASMSPRISYGRVLGWTEDDGRVFAPFTYVRGLYANAGLGRARAALGWRRNRSSIRTRS
ncbi:MAG: S46 family peptidase [Hyphomonadaceae bacterium]